MNSFQSRYDSLFNELEDNKKPDKETDKALKLAYMAGAASIMIIFTGEGGHAESIRQYKEFRDTMIKEHGLEALSNRSLN